MKFHKIFILIYLLLFFDNHLLAKNEKFNYVSSFGTVITELEDSSMTGEFLLPYGSLVDDKNEIIYVTDCPSGIINIFDLKGNFIKKLPDNCIHKNGSKNNDCLNLPADINFVKDNSNIVVSDEGTDTLYLFKNHELVSKNNLKDIGVKYLLGVDYNPKNDSYYVISSENGKIFELDNKFKIKKIIGKIGRLDSSFMGAYYLKYYKDKIFIVDQTNSRIKVYDDNLELKNIMGKKIFCSFGDIKNGLREIEINFDRGIGRVLSTIQSIFTCYEDSEDPEAFSTPHELDIDKNGNIYIADTVNNRIKIYSSDLKLIRILKHDKIKLPKVVSISQDGNTMFVGSNQLDKAVHKFELY